MQLQFNIAYLGSIVQIKPLDRASRAWLRKNTVSEPWQWKAGALAVEARFAPSILEAIRADSIDCDVGGFPIPVTS